MQETPTRDTKPYESPQGSETPQASQRSKPPRSGLAAFVVDMAKLIGFGFAGFLIISIALTLYFGWGLSDGNHNMPFEKFESLDD